MRWAASERSVSDQRLLAACRPTDPLRSGPDWAARGGALGNVCLSLSGMWPYTTPWDIAALRFDWPRVFPTYSYSRQDRISNRRSIMISNPIAAEHSNSYFNGIKAGVWRNPRVTAAMAGPQYRPRLRSFTRRMVPPALLIAAISVSWHGWLDVSPRAMFGMVLTALFLTYAMVSGREPTPCVVALAGRLDGVLHPWPVRQPVGHLGLVVDRRVVAGGAQEMRGGVRRGLADLSALCVGRRRASGGFVAVPFGSVGLQCHL
jgi:hypothetical protein